MEKTNIKLEPLFDRVLLQNEPEQQTNGGIIIPTANDDRSHTMTVIATGKTTTAVGVGDRVIVAKYAGTEVSLNEARYILVCEYDILGVVK